jgi:hypothetical protein
MVAKIEQLKKGDFLTLKTAGTPTEKNVWSYVGYNRSTKTYTIQRFNDASAFRELKKGTTVIVGFTF